jgi:hypothetical protein
LVEFFIRLGLGPMRSFCGQQPRFYDDPEIIRNRRNQKQTSRSKKAA